MANKLEISNIGKKYGKKVVVKDASFEVEAGEVVGLLGPNGAGKTTCFYMVTGLVKVDYGTIKINDNKVTYLPIYQRSRLGIGYLPQESSIFRDMNVEQNILAILEVVEPNKIKRQKRLEELLDEFSIQHIRTSSALSLSGGERRRVEIARALASNPLFILLDEPFAGIDPIAISDIIEMVTHLKKRGIGVLITDHNVRETLKIVDRAYIIYDGRVLMSGTPGDIISNPDVKRVYLGEDFQA